MLRHRMAVGLRRNTKRAARRPGVLFWLEPIDAFHSRPMCDFGVVRYQQPVVKVSISGLALEGMPITFDGGFEGV